MVITEEKFRDETHMHEKEETEKNIEENHQTKIAYRAIGKQKVKW